MGAGLARITVSGPQRRVDLALPEQVPLVELLPELLRHVGDGLADDGERHGGWLLRRTDGSPLRPGQALRQQGVRDGEVLHLVPADAYWPELEYDDVVDVIAEGARRSGAVWSSAATRATALAAAGLPLAVGLFAVLRDGPGWVAKPFTALGVAVMLVAAGVVASRAYADSRAGGVLAGWAMPYAFSGGALLVASGDRVGALGPVDWLGAPEALAGSVVLLAAAVLGAVGVAGAFRIFAAGITVGALGALTALAGFVLPARGAVALLSSALICGIGLLPLLAIRLGRLPMPAVGLPEGPVADTNGNEAARYRPGRSEVFAAVARSEELLAGMLIGHAVLATLTVLLLMIAGGVAAALLALITAVALLLRARVFVSPRQRVPMLAAGLAGLGIVGVDLVWAARPAALIGFAATGLFLALLIVTAGNSYARRPPTPYLARAADILDTTLLVSVVPVACAVLDLYDRARGLLN